MGFLKTLDFYRSKKVLLLQGPRGPFFWRLKKDLEKAGAEVYKINFNGGDWIFYPTGCINYRGKPEDFEEFLSRFLEEKAIDIVLLFSDWRPIHRTAVKVCRKKGILVGVFEEGYVRPNHITLEPMGVNGYSLLVNGNFDIDRLRFPRPRSRTILPVGNPFWHEVLWAVLYYLFANLLRPLFPHYKHHISLYLPESLFKEGLPWLLSGLKKYYYLYKERRVKERILKELSGKYFLVPLQVHNDSQIVFHSPFKDVKDFIKVVVESFAKDAPRGVYLVFKHHPRDRAYRDYTKYIKNIARYYGVEERVFYIHDAHLPTLIDNYVGVIVINSSVGLQALDHGKPTIVLGKAIYNKEGITYRGNLSDFWKEAGKFSMDRGKYRKLRDFILFYCQMNGSLHKRVSKKSYTGLVWENHDLSQCFEIYRTLTGEENAEKVAG